VELLDDKIKKKDYLIRKMMYRIMLLFTNQGGLNLDLEKIISFHSSRPRNPIIADVPFKGGYIVAWRRQSLKCWN